MKTALISAIVAAIVSVAALSLEDVFERDDDDAPLNEAGASTGVAAPGAQTVPRSVAGLSLSYTDELPEDVWVDGARTPGSDRRSLADASHSICYITKLEIKGVQDPADTNSCVIGIDDFTGYWELVATVEEGGRSQVRCNARCLVWE